MQLVEVRNYALSLPEVHEEPHFQYNSFRVNGKIIATVPPENEYLHVFVDGSGVNWLCRCFLIYTKNYGGEKRSLESESYSQRQTLLT